MEGCLTLLNYVQTMRLMHSETHAPQEVQDVMMIGFYQPIIFPILRIQPINFSVCGTIRVLLVISLADNIGLQIIKMLLMHTLGSFLPIQMDIQLSHQHFLSDACVILHHNPFNRIPSKLILFGILALSVVSVS